MSAKRVMFSKSRKKAGSESDSPSLLFSSSSHLSFPYRAMWKDEFQSCPGHPLEFLFVILQLIGCCYTPKYVSKPHYELQKALQNSFFLNTGINVYQMNRYIKYPHNDCLSYEKGGLVCFIYCIWKILKVKINFK